MLQLCFLRLITSLSRTRLNVKLSAEIEKILFFSEGSVGGDTYFFSM